MGSEAMRFPRFVSYVVIAAVTIPNGRERCIRHPPLTKLFWPHVRAQPRCRYARLSQPTQPIASLPGVAPCPSSYVARPASPGLGGVY